MADSRRGGTSRRPKSKSDDRAWPMLPFMNEDEPVASDPPAESMHQQPASEAKPDAKPVQASRPVEKEAKQTPAATAPKKPNRGTASPKGSPGRTLIIASAGSGKTYQLSNRYLRLLVDGVDPDRILAVTFTRKAAGEILDRILLRLAVAASSRDEAAQLAAALDRPGLTHEKCRERLLATLAQLHRLRVGTLDSFFAKVAGAFSLEFGLPLGWRIAEPVEEKRTRDDAITLVLNTESASDLTTLYHSLTKGATDRSVVGLIRETVEKLHGIYQETTPAAWKWMKRSPVLNRAEFERRVALFEQAEPSPDDKMLYNAHRNALESIVFENWTEFLSKGVAVKIVNGETRFSRKEIPLELVAVYAPLVQHALGTIVNRIAGQLEATYDLLAHFDKAYEQTRAVTRGLQFDDIPRVLARALDEGEADQFSFRLDGRLSHLLLDEFQDTSLDQWKVMRSFAREAMASSQGSFFCVGDPKQAIYGWRGGSAGLLLSLHEEFPQLKLESLAVSYRSSPIVIDAVNQVFTRLAQHNHLDYMAPHVETWMRQFPAHTTSRTGLPGYVELATGPFEDKEPGNEPFMEFAAARIKGIAEQTPRCTVGVLVRTNAMVGNLIYRLRALGLPASEEGGSPIVDSPAVELIVSLLTLADHPGDNAAEFHVRNSPLGAAVGLPAESSPSARAEFAQTLRRRLIDRGYGPSIAGWAEALAGECDRRDRQRLQQLVELAYGYDAHAKLRTQPFRELIAAHKADDPSASRVRVMTVHQSKGLEFDVVVLPQLDENLLGQHEAFWTDRESPLAEVTRVCRSVPRAELGGLPEEMQRMHDQFVARRVDDRLCALYVGMTRAVHALHMLVSAHDKASSLKTHAGLLRGSLLANAPMPPFQTVYQHGDPNWYSQLSTRLKAALAAEASEHPEPLPEIVLASSSPEQKRGLGRQTPSGLEGGGKIAVDKLLGLSDDHDPVAMLRGSVVHKCFEQITWLDEASPSEADLRQAILQVPNIDDADPAEVARWIRDFQLCVAKPQIARLLSKAGYTIENVEGFSKAVKRKLAAARPDVRNEYPFAHRVKTDMRQGRIDRLILFFEGENVVAAEVIDFKTDRIDGQPGRTLESKVAHYRPQMEAYKETVATLYELPPECVTSRLVFVSSDVLASV